MGEYCFLDGCRLELELLEASEGKCSREKQGSWTTQNSISYCHGRLSAGGLGGPLGWPGPVGYFPCC